MFSFFSQLKANFIEFIQQADLLLLALCTTASMFGLVLITSATQYLGPDKMMRYVRVQAIAMAVGILAYVFISMLDLEAVVNHWKWILAFNFIFIALLLTPLGTGRETTGNQAWLVIPLIPMQIGPAEVVKTTFIMLLARQCAWLKEERSDLKSFPAAFFVLGHTAALMLWYVAISGDMGNALTFFFIFLCVSFSAGFALRWFILLFGAGAGAVTAVLRMDLLPDSMQYMLDRFRILFDHELSPLGVGWQQGRSLLALGSGGLFGQGYMNGTQTQSTAATDLPARRTDLIFSVCGEEFGMIGCLAVMLLLLAIILRVLVVAGHSHTTFYRLTCVGVAGMLIYQTVINIGMCLYVMPTIGVTLPFFSYGGSSLLALYVAMGVVSAIKKQTVITRRVSGRVLS